MKKRLLFVIESLSIGGAEKSLVTLLNLMDYSKYDVDLLLFAQGGTFQQLLPPNVNLLPIPGYFEFAKIGWRHIFQKIKKPQNMISQIKYSIQLRYKKMNHIEKAVELWRICGDCVEGLETVYDAAIAYAQGTPTFFVADKVKAVKKIAWVNATYLPSGRYLDYIKNYYDQFDYVNGVSETIAEQISKTFALPCDRIAQISDILDVVFAKKMSAMPSSVHEEFTERNTTILTVGRFAAMKRYDLAVSAAAILRDRGVAFRWYSIGDGELRPLIEQQISEFQLEDQFVLLGSRSNPYPYFARCDVYVQTSEFEGFGITLAEAKMFCKPIVTTNFNSVGAQFINEENGLIVDISAEAIAEGIIRMIEDSKLREHCVHQLTNEVIGNSNEIYKLYRLIEG